MHKSTRLAAALTAAALSGGGALADGGPQRLDAGPTISSGPATEGLLLHPVICLLGSSAVADVLLYNASPSAIPAGTTIYWRTPGGDTGTVILGPGGLVPGQLIRVGTADRPSACTATL